MTNSANWYDGLGADNGFLAGNFFILNSTVEITSEVEIPEDKILITQDGNLNPQQGVKIKDGGKLINKGTIYITLNGIIDGEMYKSFEIEHGGILENKGKIYSYANIQNSGTINNDAVMSMVTKVRVGEGWVSQQGRGEHEDFSVYDPTRSGAIINSPTGKIVNNETGIIKDLGLSKNENNNDSKIVNNGTIYSPELWYVPLMEGLGYDSSKYELSEDGNTFTIKAGEYTEINKDFPGTLKMETWMSRKRLVSNNYLTLLSGLTVPNGKTVINYGTWRNIVQALWKDPGPSRPDFTDEEGQAWHNKGSVLLNALENLLYGKMPRGGNEGPKSLHFDVGLYNISINNGGTFRNHGVIYRLPGFLYLGEWPTTKEDEEAQAIEDRVDKKTSDNKKTSDSLSRIQADELLNNIKKEARFENIGGAVYDSFFFIKYFCNGKLINQRRDKVNAVFRMAAKNHFPGPATDHTMMFTKQLMIEFTTGGTLQSSTTGEIINGINEIGNNDLFCGPGQEIQAWGFVRSSIKNYGIFGAEDGAQFQFGELCEKNCDFYNNRLVNVITSPKFVNRGTFINDVRGIINIVPLGKLNEHQVGSFIRNSNKFVNRGIFIMRAGAKVTKSEEPQPLVFENLATNESEAVFENHGKFIFDIAQGVGSVATATFKQKSSFGVVTVGTAPNTLTGIGTQNIAKIINTGKVYTAETRYITEEQKIPITRIRPNLDAGRFHFVNEGGELWNSGIWHMGKCKNGGNIFSTIPFWKGTGWGDDLEERDYLTTTLTGILATNSASGESVKGLAPGGMHYRDEGMIAQNWPTEWPIGSLLIVKNGGWTWRIRYPPETGKSVSSSYKLPYVDNTVSVPGYTLFNLLKNYDEFTTSSTLREAYPRWGYGHPPYFTVPNLYRYGVIRYWYDDLINNGFPSIPWIKNEKEEVQDADRVIEGWTPSGELYLAGVASNEKIPQEGFKLTSNKTLEESLDIYTGGKLVIRKAITLILKKPSTNNGSIYIEEGGKLTLKTSLTNNGTIYVKSGGVLLADDGGATITNNKGATIYKVGDITISNSIVNNGTISESGPTEPTDAEESGGQPTIEFPELTNCDYHEGNKSYNLDNEKFQHKITMENGVSSTETVVKISSKFFANLIKYFFNKAKAAEAEARERGGIQEAQGELTELIDNEIGNMCFWNSIDIGYGTITKCDINAWIASGTDTENLYKDKEYMMDNQATIKFPIKLFQEMIDYLQKNPGECGDVPGAEEFYTSSDCIQLGCKEKVVLVPRGGSLGGLNLFPDYTALKAWVLFSEKQDEVRGKISGFLTDKYTKEDNVPIKVLIYGAGDDGYGFGLIEFTSTITPLENEGKNYRFKWEVYKKDGEKYDEVIYSTKHDNENIVVANLTEKARLASNGEVEVPERDAGWHVTYYPDKKLVPEGGAHLVTLGRAYNTPIWFYKTDDKIEIMFAEVDQTSTGPPKTPTGQVAAPYPVMEGRHTDGERGSDTIYLYVPQAEITKICKLNNIPY